MAWLFKSIVVTVLATSSWWALRDQEADRLMLERLVRSVDATARLTDAPSDTDGGKGPQRLAGALHVSGDATTSHRAYTARGEAAGGTVRDTQVWWQSEPVDERRLRIAQSKANPSDGPPAATKVGSPPERAGFATEGRPIVEDTRRRLAGSIQTELRRVGCYKGEVDGDWGHASQRAMKEFNDRVNATLPTEQPDYILLTLLQGHTTLACGAACRMGEVESGDGSCKPRAVVAESRLRAAPAPSEPAAWAQSLAQIAAAHSGNTSAPASTTSQAETQRARLAAEQDRLRLRTEAEARLRVTARETAEARARVEAATLAKRKAEADRARTEIEAARAVAQRKIDAERAVADAERARMTAADERKRQRAAESEARAEAERLARVAESERARVMAEARRRQEIDALAARVAREPKRSGTNAGPDSGPQQASAPPDALSRSTAPKPQETASLTAADERVLTGKSAPAVTAIGDAPPMALGGAPRFVARFVPPPTYRVGRLPPVPLTVARPQVQPPRVYIAAPRRAPTSAVFHYMQRHAP